MADDRTPLLSVILPVYNAMPWLPIAVRDILKQKLHASASLELLIVSDGGSDGSLEFVLALVEALGAARASQEVYDPPPDALPHNPALVQPLRAAEDEDHPSFADGPAPLAPAPLSVAAVARACRPEHTVRVLRYRDGANRGQGAAMTLGLLRSRRSAYVGQMESDDERRDEEALGKMVGALEAREEWDGVSCQVELVGSDRPGMEEYVGWQNSLCSPEAMAAGRFIEIPALHQTAIFRRAVVEEVLGPTAGCYRDGVYARREASAQAVLGAELDVPVDLWWWLLFFHHGKRCGKLGGEPLFGWRQHPRQHTRTHGRLSLENLRRIKASFFVLGPGRDAQQIQVWSIGATLEGWVAELRAAGATHVVAVDWKPGAPLPEVWRNRAKRKVPGEPELGASRTGVIRIVVFGKPKVRARARALMRDWDDQLDWFAA
ncbi:hypothetical protein AB1Y20_021355 [Prymnesium parvum]|uniref:Glycosyltransferase 2-like domain-containing protein n=1 Tax=Prymnesium parvum TaxID=97485 RepID=A0AB34JI16_PRYPA